MAADDSSPSIWVSLWRRFLAIKMLLMTVSMVGLFATNVASLVSATAHDWMHNAMVRVLSIGDPDVADRAMANSPKRQLDQVVKVRTADLDAKNRQLVQTNTLQAKELEATQIRSQKLAQQLEMNGKQAKATVAAVHQRLAKGVSRNLAALPGEAVPYLGVGLTIAVTSLDIYDACQTMKDFNALLQAMGQGEETPDLCGQKVPTKEQVFAAVKTEWRASVERVAAEAQELQMSAPEVRLPSGEELSKAVCITKAFPFLCGGKDK